MVNTLVSVMGIPFGSSSSSLNTPVISNRVTPPFVTSISVFNTIIPVALLPPLG